MRKEMKWKRKEIHVYEAYIIQMVLGILIEHKKKRKKTLTKYINDTVHMLHRCRHRRRLFIIWFVCKQQQV